MPDPKPCPNCGHCPTCGRGGYHTIPYYPPPYPWYPWYTQPYITWTLPSPTTGTVTTGNVSITGTSTSYDGGGAFTLTS